MRLGVCLNMLGEAKDPTGAGRIRMVKEAGYDYVELPLAQVMELPEDRFEALLSQLKKTGIPCESCNNFFPSSLRLTGEHAEPERAAAYARRALLRAGRLGADRIVFGSSGAKNVPDGFDRAQAWQQIVRLLQQLGPMASQEGIAIVIEPLNREESNIVLNLGDGIRLTREVDRRNVRLLVDYYHFAMEQEEWEALEKAVPYIEHVHFAEPLGRRFPKEQKEEYARFFHILRSAGYDQKVSLEAFADKLPEDLEKAMLIRKYI